jgi:aspartokinase-like uncharacterized kinase
MPKWVVVKVGGSLYSWPDLRERLRQWLHVDADMQPPASIVLVPGGGELVDVIRDLDQCHALGQEVSHWLALRALSVSAHFLAALVGAPVVDDPRPDGVRVQVLDACAFLRADEQRHECATILHTWDASADSVAARVAIAVQARQLILLKSVTIPSEQSGWQEAGHRGLVDPLFASILRTGPASLVVRVVNLRDWRP